MASQINVHGQYMNLGIDEFSWSPNWCLYIWGPQDSFSAGYIVFLTLCIISVWSQARLLSHHDSSKGHCSWSAQCFPHVMAGSNCIIKYGRSCTVLVRKVISWRSDGSPSHHPLNKQRQHGSSLSMGAAETLNPKPSVLHVVVQPELLIMLSELDVYCACQSRPGPCTPQSTSHQLFWSKVLSVIWPSPRTYWNCEINWIKRQNNGTKSSEAIYWWSLALVAENCFLTADLLSVWLCQLQVTDIIMPTSKKKDVLIQGNNGYVPVKVSVKDCFVHEPKHW